MSDIEFKISPRDIARLKKSYPDSEYLPKGSSPTWLQRLAEISKDDTGIQVLLGSVGVNLLSSGVSSRVKPEPLSVYLSGIAGIARSDRRKISIGLPPFGRDLSLLLASTSVLNKIIERGTVDQLNYQGVLIISPDIGIRSLYCNMFIRQEPLDRAFPGSRMLPDGKIEPLGRNVHKIYSGVCFFLPFRRNLPKNIAIKPDIIILDLRYSRLNSKVEDLVKWVSKVGHATGIVVLYTLGDRLTRSVLQNSKFCDFPIDHSAISASKDITKQIYHKNDSLDIDLSDAADALNRKHVIKNVTLPPELKNAFVNLIKLFGEHNENDHPEVNRLRWLFAVYSQMPVPLVWYENRARAMGRWVPKNVIKRIGTNSRDIGKLGPVLQTFRANFTQLNNLYETINPKAEELKKVILAHSDKLSMESRLLILVRDPIMESAMSSWISLKEFQGEKWLSYIDVVSCKKFVQYTSHRYKYFISCGALHFQYRWILGANLGRNLYFVVYPHEIDIVQKQIDQFYNREYIDQRVCSRGEAIKTIGANSCSQIKDQTFYPELDISILNQEKVKQEFKHKVTSFDDLQSVFNKEEEQRKKDRSESVVDLNEIGERAVEESDPEYSLEEVKAFAHDTEGVTCWELSVLSKERGKGRIWISEETYVEYIRPSNSSELLRTSPQSLKPGDLILVVDERQQDGIFDRLIEIADSNPQLQYMAVYRNLWRKAIDLLSAKHQKFNGKIDYTAMYGELKMAGIKITSIQALQNWVNDIVIGPEDISSIIAVGQTSGMEELSKKAKEFNDAFYEIRTLHRTIGRRVASVIRKTFAIVAKEEESIGDNLQESMGVPLNEIINAIEIAEVVGLTLSKQPVIPDLVGKFIKD